MKLFPMTCDRFHAWTPIVIGPLLLLPMFAVGRMPPPAGLLTVAVLAGVVSILGIATLLAPRGVRVTAGELELVRLAWPSFRVPMSQLLTAERGPDVKISGSVIRLAGVGGWFWSGGLFRARGIGNVRAWMTQLGPTLLLRRRAGLPILLRVDDVDGLLQELARRGLVRK